MRVPGLRAAFNPLAMISLALVVGLLVALIVGTYYAYAAGLLTAADLIPNLLSEGAGILLTTAIVAPLSYYLVSAWLKLRWRPIVENALRDGFAGIRHCINTLGRWAVSMDTALVPKHDGGASVQPYLLLAHTDLAFGREEVAEANTALGRARQELEKILIAPNADEVHRVTDLISALEPLQLTLEKLSEAYGGKEMYSTDLNFPVKAIADRMRRVSRYYDLDVDERLSFEDDYLKSVAVSWLNEGRRSGRFNIMKFSPLHRFALPVMMRKQELREEFCSILASSDQQSLRQCGDLIAKGHFAVQSASSGKVVFNWPEEGA